MATKKVKLSAAQYWTLEQIRQKGSCYFANNQNPTAKKLIAMGLCDWNREYTHLIFTKLGKEIEL